MLSAYSLFWSSFIIIPQLFRFVNPFFEVFSNLFSRRYRSSPRSNFYIISHCLPFVKYFFDFFQKSFSKYLRLCKTSFPFVQIFRFPSYLAPLRQLFYYITFFCLCQAFRMYNLTLLLCHNLSNVHILLPKHRNTSFFYILTH